VGVKSRGSSTLLVRTLPQFIFFLYFRLSFLIETLDI